MYFAGPPEYLRILSDLGKKWVEIEIFHKVSHEASSSFWRVANEMFHPLYVAKGNGGRKIPQFQQLRERMKKDKVPKVNMEVGFQSKDDGGEITILKDVTSIPVSRFPPSRFNRIYEIAFVDVSCLVFFCFFFSLKRLHLKEMKLPFIC